MMNGSLFKQILVPTDGSASSVAAGRLALKIASILNADVAVLHVLDERVLQGSARASDESETEVEKSMRRDARSYLNHLAAMARQYDIDARQEMREGDPHDEIVSFAKEILADLIVMSHAGRRGPRRKIVGSVAERVIRFSQCPVMITKQ
jgi:nucleotide-binding universal stress UspA family protein